MSVDRRGSKAPEVFFEQPGMEVLSETVGKQHYQGYVVDYVHSDGVASQKHPPKKSNEGIIGFAIGFLCSLVIVGAALGGGLGARLSSCQRSVDLVGGCSLNSSSGQVTAVTSLNPDSSVTTTSASSQSTTSSGLLTDFKVTDPDSIDLLHNDCTTAAFTNKWGNKFITDPGQDYSFGKTAAEGGVVMDIAGIITYSFGDCLNACSGLNDEAVKHGFPTKCYSITFSLDMKNSTGALRANCWLKNGTLYDASKAGRNPHCMSARLAS